MIEILIIVSACVFAFFALLQKKVMTDEDLKAPYCKTCKHNGDDPKFCEGCTFDNSLKYYDYDVTLSNDDGGNTR